MKLLPFIFAAIFLLNQSCFSQEKLTKEIKEITDQLLDQVTGISAKNKLGKDSLSYKIAIVGIENENKKQTTLTELLENKIAINLATKSFGKFDVLDRNYIESMMTEKNLPLKYNNNNDFAKDLGKIKAAHLIIVGTLSDFENDFELNLQVIETKEGNTIGGASGLLTATQLLKSKNGPAIVKKEDTRENYQERPDQQINLSSVGKITIENNSRAKLRILLSTVQIMPTNGAAKYEELTVASNSADNFESVLPGEYYICAVESVYDFDCVYRKKVVVERGKTIKVVIR